MRADFFKELIQQRVSFISHLLSTNWISIGFPALIFMVLRGKTQDFVIIIENKLTNQL